MYCKYCGSRMSSNSTKCVSCGANIDFNDGGQSFFDDNELEAWQSDNMMQGSKTSIPRTDMRQFEDYEFSEDYSKMLPSVSAQKGTDVRTISSSVKRKKSILDFLNLSSSNKLIIFCIASAVAIVLLTVAIIAVLSSGDDTGTDKNNSTVNQTVQNSSYGEQSNEKERTKTEQSAAEENADDEQSSNDEVSDDKTEIKDIKIFDMDGEKVSHPVSAYIKDGTLYVSLDKILKHEGYKAGQADDDNENRILYEHKSSGKVIEIEKGTDMIWIGESGEEAKKERLDSDNFNVGDDTYVPIKSFLEKYGYKKVRYDVDSKTLYFVNNKEER